MIKYKKQNNRLVKKLLVSFVILSPAVALPQIKVYRCGNEYTSSEELARARSCKLLSGGTDVGKPDLPKTFKAAPKLSSPVQIDSAPAMIGTGSGFRVSKDGVVVTNNHVVLGCNSLKVERQTASIVATDSTNDLALISTATRGPLATIRATPASVGEVVEVAGYPLNGLLSGFNMTIGSVSSLAGIRGDTRYLQITAPVQSGNSGGPLMDSGGNVFGVVVAKLNAVKLAQATGDVPQNVNFAINGGVLRKFLDRNKQTYEITHSVEPVPSTIIAAKAIEFTVLIECWK